MKDEDIFMDEDRVTPDNITELPPNSVFVFGSNTQGRHGRGAALLAKRKFRAIYGQARGLQGQSYAIVTKDLTKPYEDWDRSVPLSSIQKEISEFISFAEDHPQLQFLVTKIGCSLAGYSIEEIASLFPQSCEIPNNVSLPLEFWRVIDERENT